MSDARHFSTEDTLRNGTRITIRAARPDDRERIAKAFKALDRESVYTRFFAYKAELSAADLAKLDAMDFLRDVMLVATIRGADDEIVVGSARYVAYDAADGKLAAEVAFIVEEDYHGLGIASRLLGHLITLARAAGIARFEADVLPGNKAMLGVFTRCRLPMHRERGDGVVHLALSLGGTS